ncbi:GRP family sugar transporter [Metabacillus arenae]|uniref:Glucose transporter GlcU n=1 Tax=Metabacillus arenae TaxID=2771434 RepID=A0A926N7H6_9BACI|nr:GRP family sugar transporter [Metabacillus arenae]MBD1378742.1 glucose transporter GlcU [Metabacillus arenae]
MGILLALIPAVTWGSILLVSSKLGGDDYSKTVGTTLGALLFSIGVFIFSQPEMSMLVWIIGFISGLFWAVGQKNQFTSVKYMGVSKTLPISTGMQLLGTTLFGVLVFHEWSNQTTIILGSIAILAIIIGVVFTSLGQKAEDEEYKKNLKRGMMKLLISTIGYVGYIVIIRWFDINGWAAILPQALGMVAAGTILTIKHRPYNRYAFRNIVTGLIWAAGNLGLLLSLPLVGVATSFSLSQTGIVISTLGGIFLLNEKATRKQIVYVIIGCLLIIAGGVLLGYTKE